MSAAVGAGGDAGRSTAAAAAALLLWCGALALAFWAQHLLTPLGEIERGGWIYAVAALLGMAATALQGPPPSAARSEAEPAAAVAGRRWWPAWPRVVLALASFVAIAAVVYLVASQQGYGLAAALWGVSLCTAAAAVAPATPLRLRRPSGAQIAEAALVFAILALALALRLPALDQIPPEVHGDEAACGIEGRRILHGEVTNLFTVGWYHIPNLSFAISALSMRLFGDDLFGLRMASVLQGTGSILLLYLIARRLFSIRVAALAALLLAVSHWHIHFSRAGISYMQALFATVLVLHLLLRGLERRRALDFMLAGFAAGLCLNVYYAARLAPFLAAFHLAYLTLTERGFLRRQWRGIAAMAAGAAIFLAPMGVVYLSHPDTLMTRTEGVFILGERNLQHAYAAYEVERPLDVLRVQAVNTLTAFNLRGETSQQHARRAPLLDFWTGALLVLGVAGAVPRLRQAGYLLLFAWLGATLLLGSVLTVDALFSPRVIVALPALCLFPALFLEEGWRGLRRLGGRAGDHAGAVLLLALVVLAARSNYHDYFEGHIIEAQPAGFNTLISRYVLGVNDRYRVYLMGRADTSLRYDTERLLLPEVDGVDVRDAELALPLDLVPEEKGVAFVVEHGIDSTEGRMATLREAYPGGVETLHETVRGYPVFYSYLVEREELLAANSDAKVRGGRIPGSTLLELAAAGELPSIDPRAPSETRPLSFAGVPTLLEPREVAVDGDGRIYLLDRLQARVHRFTRDGTFIETIGAPGDGPGLLLDPRGLAVTADGAVLVLDAEKNRISRFGPDAAFRDEIELPGGYHPSGLSVDGDGRMLVADTGLNRVLVIDPSGEVIQILGGAETRPSPIDQPTDAARGPGGEIYVADSGRQRIVVFGPGGEVVREWEVPHAGTLFGTHLAVAADAVLVSDPEGGRLLLFSLEGEQRHVLGAGDLKRPIGVAFDGEGNVLAADESTRAVHRYPLP